MSSEGSAGEQRDENAPAYKSTPLRPAIIMTTVLVWALVVALIVRVPAWASVFLAVLTGASFLAFLVGYIYLFVRDRESLRTGRARRAALATKLDAGAREAVAAGSPAQLRPRGTGRDFRAGGGEGGGTSSLLGDGDAEQRHVPDRE